jgi:serine/threonine protein kinase
VSLIGQQIGGYEVVSALGEGGISLVYRARQLNVQRDVALKIIKPEFATTPNFVERFKLEAQTIAALSHPHIGKLFDYGQQDGRLYLVMELFRGGSVGDLLRRGPLAVDVAMRILEQIASALDYAHARGIVHRDVKPQNILLDEQGNAFLTDFGIVKLVNVPTNLTGQNMVIGSPAYMPPEEWEESPLDGRADVYSLGITLYEMLTGQVPFKGKTLSLLMRKHLFEDAPLLRDLNPAVPGSVEPVLAKALAKDSQQRFGSAGEFAAAFRRAVTSDPAPIAIPEDRARLAAAVPTMPNASVTAGSAAQPSFAQAADEPGWSRRIGPSRTLVMRRNTVFLAIGGVVVVSTLSLICLLTLLWVISNRNSVIEANLKRTQTLSIAPTSIVPTSAATNPFVPSPEATIVPTAIPSSTPTAVALGLATFRPAATGIASGQGRGQGQIVFVSERGGMATLYVMSGSGDDARLLTQTFGQMSLAAWSPDGSRIAFETSQDGNKEIYVMNADGSNIRRLSNNGADDWLPTWSPDGTQIAFTSERDGNREIYVMSGDGSNQRRLTNHPSSDWLPAWSPDSTQIAFTSERSGSLQIYVMDTSGQNVRQLTSIGSNFSPAWSPDGTQIAFTSERDGNREIYVMSADGNGQRRLTNHSALDFFPTWSPDGLKIAFTSERDGNQEIYIVNIDGSGLTRVTNSAGNDFGPIWRP